MRLTFSATMLAVTLALCGGAASAQGTALGFQGLQQDPNIPIEVTSDELAVDQARGAAVFTGNVVVVQGALRLGAKAVEVEYGADGSGIRRLTASGGVTFATAADAAEAEGAVYEVETGALELTGGVLLTQGAATISGDRLVADLRSGTGRMEGRVRTTFRPGADK